MDIYKDSFIVLVSTAVFFAGAAWLYLVKKTPDWVRAATGVAAAILALSALMALL